MKEKWNCTPRVYVGTYKKYNEGSLRGGWLTLTDYPSYDTFMEACFKLHKDERDPELMIQDCEDMPDGLSVMESISREEYDDIIAACKEPEEESEEQEAEELPKFRIIDYSEKAIAVVGDTKDIKDQLKALCGRFNPKLSCGAGWIFSKKMQPEVEKLLKGGSVEKSSASDKSKAKKDDGSAVWKKNLEEFCAKSGDPDYYKKHSVGAVKLNGGYYVMDKESIDTKFCFADEGPDYDYYLELMRDEKKLERYFVAENLSGIDRRIELLAGTKPLVIYGPYRDGRVSFGDKDYGYGSPDSVDMTQEQRTELLNAYRWKRTEFEKRLQSYLKRYGTTKLHTWTYWRDA